ncbi:MAG: integrase [Flavobacteriaceae bacterium]|nr:integrase [Flavobacteriaceae bacterium]|tara:strand:- start:681 stop:1559 length:879 start_codon:yes stop_codon:yes gene_type:complete
MLEKFFDYLTHERKYAAHTITSYKNDLQGFEKFIKEEFDLDDLSQVHYSFIRNWILQLSKNGLSNLSINRKISSLKTFYKFLQKVGSIDKNPLVGHKSLKVQKKIQVPFSRKEIQEVIDGLDGDDFESLRNKAMIEVFYSTGIRRAELIGIKLSDVNLEDKTIRILGKRNKERFVPLLNSVEKSLSDYLKVRDTVAKDKHLFVTAKGNKIYETLVYRVINSYFSLASSKQKKSPHILRHSFATHLLNEGANLNSVKELLGHSSLASTQVYTKNSLETLKQMYNQAHPRSNKN